MITIFSSIYVIVIYCYTWRRRARVRFAQRSPSPLARRPCPTASVGVSWTRIIMRTMMMVVNTLIMMVNTMIMMITTYKYEKSCANTHSLGSSYQAQKDWRLQRWGLARYSPVIDHVIVTLSIFKFTVMSLP